MERKSIVRYRISGVCGVLTPVVTFVFISLSIASAPEFSWMENALSDLGVMPGATSALFNYGLIVSGILVLSSQQACSDCCVLKFFLVIHGYVIQMIGV